MWPLRWTPVPTPSVSSSTPAACERSAWPGGATTLDFGNFADSEPGSLADGGTTTPGQFDATDPLARKLELADEFRQIGDMEGARDLLEEVVAKSAGALRAKARAMLDALG